VSAFLPPYSLEMNIADLILFADKVQRFIDVVLDSEFVHRLSAPLEAAIIVNVNIPAWHDLVIEEL
jgi:hypothetical protein